MSMKRILWLLALGATPLCVMAQTCSGNQDFYGAYLFVATSAENRPEPAVAPPAMQFSNTPIGQTLRNVLGQERFATVGRLIADGLGTVFAAPADAETITTRVGVYRVNGDCTMSLVLFDGFNTGIDIIGNPLVRGAASFEGVLQDRGNEANFVQAGTGWLARLSLARPQLAQGCTNATLSGAYGVAGSGTQTTRVRVEGSETPVTVLSPVSVVGRFVADGAGGFRPDTPGLESPQPKRQITGSYQVRADCTGTARLVMDNQTYPIEFVLLRGGVRFGEFSRAAMRFVLAGAGMVGTGSAR
jgi:hypothetical protein